MLLLPFNYFANSRTVLVTKLATLFIDNVEMLQNYATDKFLKYNNVLLDRLGTFRRDKEACIVFQVIVVSSSSIVCSYETSQENVDLFTFRFRIAKSIIEYLRMNHNWVKVEEERLDVSRVRAVFTRMTLPRRLIEGRIDQKMKAHAVSDVKGRCCEKVHGTCYR